MPPTSVAPARRGRRFDWLYDRWCQEGQFASLGDVLRIGDTAAAEACRRNRHHEERAALVCLLTAACVVNGTYVAIGAAAGGYIFLPPWTSWASWAQYELERQRRRVANGIVWIDGRFHAPIDLLPTGQWIGEDRCRAAIPRAVSAGPDKAHPNATRRGAGEAQMTYELDSSATRRRGGS